MDIIWATKTRCDITTIYCKVPLSVSSCLNLRAVRCGSIARNYNKIEGSILIHIELQISICGSNPIIVIHKCECWWCRIAILALSLFYFSVYNEPTPYRRLSSHTAFHQRITKEIYNGPIKRKYLQDLNATFEST
ncbi:hypothetical protein M2298_004149 [Brevibacillus sp. 1238]|nr:hypothetical protein [Brevibacillus sp. 1238]